MRTFVLALVLIAGCATPMPAPTIDAGTDAPPHDANLIDVDHTSDAGAMFDMAMIAVDVGIDAPTDDVGVDASHDASAIDASADAHVVDAGTDAVVVDAGSDAYVVDVGVDAATADAGCASCPSIVLLAGSSSSMLTGQFVNGWVTAPIAGALDAPPSLAALQDGTAIGAFTESGSARVMTTTWTGTSWSTPIWTGTATSRAQPFVDASGTFGHLAYHGTDYHFYDVGYAAGVWATSSTSIGGSYGPVPPAIAARGSDATVAFVDGEAPMVNYVAARDLSSGAWQSKADLAPSNITIPPAIVALDVGPELLLTFVHPDNGPSDPTSQRIEFATRSAGTWSTPSLLMNCYTSEPVALAALPGGRAILAFRGNDSNLYWLLFDGSAWSAVAPFATPNVAIPVPPAVADGAGANVAEIAFVQLDGMAYHASLRGGVWSAPVAVGGTSLLGVAIATP